MGLEYRIKAAAGAPKISRWRKTNKRVSPEGSYIEKCIREREEAAIQR